METQQTEQEPSRKIENEPVIEVPLDAEQYARLRAWLKNGDYIEVATGPGETKATLINARKLFERNHPDLKAALGCELLDFRVRLLSPFADFIEKYLEFFNAQGSLESFVAGTVYEKVRALHDDLTRFVKAKGHRLGLQGWLEKFPEGVHGNEDEENDSEN